MKKPEMMEMPEAAEFSEFSEISDQSGKPEKPLSFEERLDRVKSVIDRIEGGQLPLEESVRQYEEGIRSLNALEQELAEMKRRITVLQRQPDGSLAEEEMEESL